MFIRSYGFIVLEPPRVHEDVETHRWVTKIVWQRISGQKGAARGCSLEYSSNSTSLSRLALRRKTQCPVSKRVTHVTDAASSESTSCAPSANQSTRPQTTYTKATLGEISDESLDSRHAPRALHSPKKRPPRSCVRRSGRRQH